MVVYTPAAKAARGGEAGIRSYIDLQVGVMNLALRESETNAGFKLVYVREVSYTESGSHSTDLTRFIATSDGYMDETVGWAGDHNAGKSVLVVSAPGGGIAGLLGTRSLIGATSTGSGTMAHEVGHNLGCGHESGQPGSDPYAQGYQFTAVQDTWRTIMHYAPGIEIFRYSNPDQTFLDQPSGTAIEDNAREIRKRMFAPQSGSSINASPTVAITSPTNGANYNAQDSLTIDVSASDSDGTVYQVDYFMDDYLLGSDTVLPFDVTWGPLPAGQHILHATAIDNEGDLTWSCPVTINVGTGIVLPWLEHDIGVSINTGVPGSVDLVSGTFSTTGSGRGLEGSNDGFNYIHQNICGDGEIVAHVASLTNTGSWASAGVMIRTDIRPNSPFVSLELSASNGFVLHRRTSDTVKSTRTSDGNVQAQGWVKIVRTGTTFDLYTSPDNIVWTPFVTPSVTIAALSGSQLVGISTTTSDNSIMTDATIDNVSLTDSSPCPTYTLTFTITPTSTVSATTTSTYTYTFTPTPPPDWAGWTFENFEELVYFHVVQDGVDACANSHTAPYAMWFGRTDGTCTYANDPSWVAGQLQSPWVVMPAGARLSFWSWEETENVPGLDRRRLRITDGSTFTDTLYESSNNDAAWYQVDVDLSSYAGQNVQYYFSFWSASVNNDFGGWYVDDVLLYTPSPTPTSTFTISPTYSPTDTPTDTETITWTATWTATWSPTHTPSSTPTWTPTASPTGTSTWTPTWTPTRSPTGTDTHTPTWTPTWTSTLTPTYTPTWTPTWTPTSTPTHSPTYTGTFTWTPTWTSTGTSTWTSTNTPTWTPTLTATPTGTDTHTSTWSPTFTYTPTYSPTYTPSDTLSHSGTITWTLTPSRTASLTPTSTWSPTGVPSTTVTPTSTFTPAPEDLSAVHPYPNPVDVVTGNETVRFADLSGDVEVRIYTASGRLVVALKNGASLELDWDLRNGRGQLVGAGIYFWVATNQTGGRKTGQLAIIK